MLAKKVALDAIRSRKFTLFLIPLVLTSFTHLWNPVGFPDLFYDEGVYLRRAMHVLEGLGPQESPYYYDHPFFGQLFLAGIFKLLNFPGFITDNNLDDIHIDSLFLVPRLIMGGLAILDTFLVYRISERKYGTNVALVASVLFAVMPMTWILRRVLLDSILVPFLLSAILFALNSASSSNRKYLWTLVSGISLGLAIFVKVPVFAMIPLLCYLILQPNYKSAKERRYKLLLLWFMPVILIPSLWPLESILSGHFDSWFDTVIWQAERGNRAVGLPFITGIFVIMDPILFALTVAGGIYAIIRKNRFILLWEVPLLVFLAAIGQTNYFHWAALLPVFCIASSIVLVEGLPRLLTAIKVNGRKITFASIVSISFVGLIFTTIVISTDVSLSQRQALSYTISHLERNEEDGNAGALTTISSPSYSWVFKYVYRADHTLNDFRDVIFDPLVTSEWVLIVDEHFRSEMQFEPKLRELYEQGRVISSFNSYPLAGIDSISYPYTNLLLNVEGCDVEVTTKKIDPQEVLSQDVGSKAMDPPQRCDIALERLLADYKLK